MPLPVIDSRPEKTINNVLSRWNVANLPMIYDISNTKWPTNTEDAQVNFVVVSDNDGFARVATVVAGIVDVKGWVTISGSTLYDGIHQVLGTTGAGLNYILNTPFISTDTGQIQRYFQNYTLLIQVNAGIDPGHTHAATKPIELIGTIEQRPDSVTGITSVDVRKYVKNKINFNYDESQASFPNDLNAWTDFYIAVAERFDAVSSGLVVDSVSVFTDDTEGVYSDIIFLKAAVSSLPFGYPFGGNLGEYVIDDVIYFNTAKWLTDFLRGKLIDNNNFNVSIIAQQTPFDIEIKQFDLSGTLIETTLQTISDEDYGLYRVSPEAGFLALTSFFTIQAQILGGNITSEIFTVDVDNVCSTPAPATATDLVATAISNSRIDLTWTDNSNGLASYEVFRGTSSGNLTLLTTIANASSFSNTGLLYNEEFFYEVRPLINSIRGAFSNEDNATTLTTSWVWASESASEANSWDAIVFGDKWVAISLNGTNRVMTSPDGSTWTARSAASASAWRGIAYNGSIYVAVGTNAAMSSPDGITWTTRTIEASSWKDVTYSSFLDLFIAVASAGTNRVSTSPDGITWTSRTAAEANQWNDVESSSSLLVAVASTGTNRVMTSVDGITWNTASASQANSWVGLAFGVGLFVATSNDGANRVMTSPDGTTWTNRSATSAVPWPDVTFGGDNTTGIGFVAVSNDPSQTTMVSLDGINWTAKAAEGNQWEAVAFGNSQCISVSADGTNRVQVATGNIL